MNDIGGYGQGQINRPILYQNPPARDVRGQRVEHLCIDKCPLVGTFLRSDGIESMAFVGYCARPAMACGRLVSCVQRSLPLRITAARTRVP